MAVNKVTSLNTFFSTCHLINHRIEIIVFTKLILPHVVVWCIFFLFFFKSWCHQNYNLCHFTNQVLLHLILVEGLNWHEAHQLKHQPKIYLDSFMHWKIWSQLQWMQFCSTYVCAINHEWLIGSDIIDIHVRIVPK